MTSYAVRIERHESLPLAVIRRQANWSELARVVPECCGLVWDAVRSQETKGGRHVAVYWDGAIRLEVGVELLGPFVEQGEVVRSATPGGTVALATHFGPYSGLGGAHAAIHGWCAANRRPPAGPRWEIYGHWQRDWNTDPSQIRTDVHYLLAEDSGV